MNKILPLLFASILVAGQSLAQDSRVVYSETFETADDVANWGVFVGTTGNTTKTHNATGGVGGSGALELGDAGYAFLIERPITVTAGSEYLLTLDVKTSGWDNQIDYPLYITLDGIDANPKIVYINGSTDFTTISVGGTASGSSGHIKIVGANTLLTNNVWVDNISLSVNQSFTLESLYSDSFDSDSDVAQWGVFVGTSGSTTKSHNPTGGVDGGGALEFGDAGYSFLIERPIAATVDKNYLFTLDIKIEEWASNRPIYLTVDGIDANPKRVVLNNLNGLTEFTTITLAGTATGSSGHIRIIGANGFVANKVWVDNISFNVIDMNAVVWNGSSWNSGSEPTVNDNVIVDGALTIAGDLGAKNIEVTGNGSVTIESGASLAIMESALGDATIKRNTTGNAGYSIVGSPVFGADLSALSADYLQTWDGSAWSTPVGPMAPGVGYFVGYNATTPEVSLTGALVSGDQSAAVSTAGDGFNLVANPYASAISITSFLTANSNIDATVYLWNDGGQNANATDRAGDYVTVNSIGTVDSEDLGDGVSGTNITAANTAIGSMQGFLVHATSDANVDFTPTMQTITAGANADDNYYRNANQPTLKLALSGAHYNEVLFGFRSDATFGVDRMYDAVKRIGNQNFAFYSTIEDQKFAIQGLPELNGDMSIGLGYDVKEAGTYELSIKELVGIPTGYNVIATYNGTDYNLSDASASLNLSAGQGRIELTLTNAVLASVLPSTFKVYTNGTQLNIQMAASIENANIQIFDLTGRTLVTLANERFSNGMWSKHMDLKSGDVYILKVQSKEGMLTQKFIY